MNSDKMKVLRATFVVVVVVVVCLGNGGGGKRAAAEVQHVVGDDRGWAASPDVGSWISGRVFTVGDKIWFAYSPAHESILELLSVEEFLLCDLSNPIRMYNNGLDKESLDSEGMWYFASGSLESCRNGLKLPVNVQPPQNIHSAIIAVTEGPASPSASAPAAFAALSVPLFLGFAVSLFLSP